MSKNVNLEEITGKQDVLSRLRLATRLPGFVWCALENPPAAGSGQQHDWLFKTARHLHPHIEAASIAALLAALAPDVDERELRQAVLNSERCAWQPRNPKGWTKATLPWLSARLPTPRTTPTRATQPTRATIKPLPKWPEPDRHKINLIIEDGPGLAGLKKVPPDLDRFPREYAKDFLQRLFWEEAEPDPLLCIGVDRAQFNTHPLSKWLSVAFWQAQFIVPSPMTARRGQTQEGHLSAHTLDNTGPRRFLVIEFDNGTPDEQASLLLRLSEYLPLVMVVFSGSKSLHGWFYVKGEPEEELLIFMRYSVSVGADKATWTRSQFVRLPCGVRQNKDGGTGPKQMVKYWNPEVLP